MEPIVPERTQEFCHAVNRYDARRKTRKLSLLGEMLQSCATKLCSPVSTISPENRTGSSVRHMGAGTRGLL